MSRPATATALRDTAERSDGWSAGVMFTDVVASTALLGNIGERAWIELLDRHRRAAEVIVERHGGHIVAFVGDGFTALLPSAEAAVTLGNALVAEGETEAGLEMLLAAVQTDPKAGEGAARQAMLDVFNVLGGDEPLVRAYRAKLARALF